MKSLLLYFLTCVQLFAITLEGALLASDQILMSEFSEKTEDSFMEESSSPLLLEYASEFLKKAEHSILIKSPTFSNSKFIEILNQKAHAGLDIQLIVGDNDFSFNHELDLSIRLETSLKEGLLSPQILIIVMDHEHILIGSWREDDFRGCKNPPTVFFSPEIAAQLYQEKF